MDPNERTLKDPPDIHALSRHAYLAFYPSRHLFALAPQNRYALHGLGPRDRTLSGFRSSEILDKRRGRPLFSWFFSSFIRHSMVSMPVVHLDYQLRK